MKVDVLIIGQGLAGSLLAWELLKRDCRIMIIDNGEENASQVAAGLINPVTGIRLVKAPEIDTLLPIATRLYAELAEYFQQTFYIEKPMLRILRNANEANYAANRLADPAYREYIAEAYSTDTRPSPFGCMQQNHTGYLLTQSLLSCLKAFFISKNCYRVTNVNYSEIELGSSPRWQDISTQHIVFCEGHRATDNPWFSWLPFRPVKGEILTLSHQATLPDNILNNGHWLIPTTDQQLRVGATFDRGNLNILTTEAGKNELLDTMQTLMPGFSAEIIAHKANIRPCTADRKPFIGRHPHNPQLLIFNGFGAKGSLQIPWYSRQFVQYVLNGNHLPTDCDIKRYAEKH